MFIVAVVVVVVVVVVVFTLNRSFYRHQQYPQSVSFLILHPRDTNYVVTDSSEYRTYILCNIDAKGGSVTCSHGVNDVPTLIRLMCYVVATLRVLLWHTSTAVVPGSINSFCRDAIIIVHVCMCRRPRWLGR